jgi:hypothetical protein
LLKRKQMKNALYPIMLLVPLAFSSCRNTSVSPVEQKLVKNPSLIIGNPLDCGIENMQLFPVGSNYIPAVYEGDRYAVSVKDAAACNFVANTSSANWDRNASVEYVNQSADNFDITNILFYDLASGKSYPLVRDTFHILSFALHKEFAKPRIFFRIVKTDINQDSLFNDKDPVMLYASDLDGKNLIQMTPDNEHFNDYFYYANTQKILVKTSLDANKDSTFNVLDEINFREVQLNAPTLGREIFTRSMRDSLRVF